MYSAFLASTKKLEPLEGESAAFAQITYEERYFRKIPRNFEARNVGEESFPLFALLFL